MIRCALLTNFRNDWAAALVLACEGLDFVTLSPAVLGIDDAPNPFALAEDDRADVILITSYWRRWLEQHHAARVKRVMTVLAGSAEALVGVDGMDYFELGFEPGGFEGVASIIKFQGIFRDRELYNYDVGPWHPGANWSQKLRPKARRYGTHELDKLHLSVPSLMLDLPGPLRSARRYESGEARTIAAEMSRTQRLARDLGEEMLSRLIAVAPVGHRPLDVQCLATLTHVQRLDAIRRLEGLSGTRGIDRIPDNVAGVEEVLSRPSRPRQDVRWSARPRRTCAAGSAGPAFSAICAGIGSWWHRPDTVNSDSGTRGRCGRAAHWSART